MLRNDVKSINYGFDSAHTSLVLKSILASKPVKPYQGKYIGFALVLFEEAKEWLKFLKQDKPTKFPSSISSLEAYIEVDRLVKTYLPFGSVDDVIWDVTFLLKYIKDCIEWKAIPKLSDEESKYVAGLADYYHSIYMRNIESERIMI